MKKIVLTMKQADQLLDALDDYYYEKQSLLDVHSQRIKTGIKWRKYKDLNELTVGDMKKALFEGYDIEGENVHHYSLEQLQNAYKKPKNYESSLEELQVDIDYHLDGLGLAVKEENEQEIEYHKKQLKKLVEEKEKLK